MDFNLKKYQTFKLKRYFKTNHFFLIFHSAKLNLSQWIIIEQSLKKLKLHCYKPLNGVVPKTLKKSAYRNISSIFSSFVVFIHIEKELDLNLSIKSFKPLFTLIALKLNNNVYSSVQLKGSKNLSYRKNIFDLYKTLDKHLKKTSYSWANHH